MLTTFDLDEYLYEAMKAGASGFLLKDAPREQLLHAVRLVAAGTPHSPPRWSSDWSTTMSADQLPEHPPAERSRR